MYTILIKYQTGDSFGNEDTEDTVGYVWEDLETAKVALQRIKHHYYACKNHEDNMWRPNRLTPDQEFKDAAWYCNSSGTILGWQHYVLVPDNEDGETRVYTFWNGHFESLHSAEIVRDDADNNDMKFTP